MALGGDNRMVLTGQYFNVWGTADATLFGTDPVTGPALTPNSNGWIAEIAYIPFGVSKSIGWPWFNARIELQYIYYNKSTAPRSAPRTTTPCSSMPGLPCRRPSPQTENVR